MTCSLLCQRKVTDGGVAFTRSAQPLAALAGGWEHRVKAPAKPCSHEAVSVVWCERVF